MSGHSKWATIKRDKAANDSKRSQAFSKLSRLITVSAKKGADIDSNPSLRLAVEKAREARMPKENVEKAIAKGSGQGGSASFEEITYEGFGPHGVAFMVTALTDNRNRTVAELRSIFSRKGGNLGGAGSTAYIFGADPKNPTYMVDIVDEGVGKALMDFVEELEDHDDVQEVFYNFNLVE